MERTRSKLGNPSFVEKAPAAVVQKERDKVTELESAMEKLEEQAAKIKTL
jgi:valyl-tRNA synthetase